MISLREANKQDWARLLYWRNSEQNLAAFAGKGEVSIEEHLKWLDTVLAHKDSYLYIATEEASSNAVGMIRFEAKRSKKKDEQEIYECEISIAVDQVRRSRGYGRNILFRGMVKVLADRQKVVFRANVQSDNYASLRLFTDLGFNLDDYSSKLYRFSKVSEA